MRRVILESPYAGDIQKHVEIARSCLRHSLLLGEAPIASHLLYPQDGVLIDEIAAERDHGIAAGLAWFAVAEAAVVYLDFGVSSGMEKGIERARSHGVPVEFRVLK